MRRRRRVVVVAAAVVVAAIAGTAIVLLAGRDSSPAKVTPQQAEEAARSSCAAAVELERLVGRNAGLDDVRRALRTAETEADTAAHGDTRWLALDGGVKSVRIGIDSNDARA